jgi:hypothetical protein
VTEELSKTPLNPAQFNGIPSLLRQLNEDQIETVGQLPRELVILAKYEGVGVGTVEKLFEQLKSRQIIYYKQTIIYLSKFYENEIWLTIIQDA